MAGCELLSLPMECFQSIIEGLLETVDLSEAARLRAVSKTFNREILYRLARKSVLITFCRENKPSTCWPTSQTRTSALRFLAACLRTRPHAQFPWDANVSSLFNYLVDAILRSEGLDSDDSKGLSYMYELCRYVDRTDALDDIIYALKPSVGLGLHDTQPESLITIGRIVVGLPVSTSELRDETINEGPLILGTPLRASLFTSRLDLIQHILSRPTVDVNTFPHLAIDTAVRNCSIDIVRLLLAPNLRLETDNRGWEDSVVLSISLKRPEITRLLLEHCSGELLRVFSHGMWEAVLTGQIDIVGLLLDMGADANVNRAYDNEIELVRPSPIELAAWKGYNDIVQLLLDRGAHQPELRALRAAAEQGHVHTARLLFREYDHPWYSEAQAELLLVAITAHQHEFLDYLIDEGHVDIPPLVEDEDDFEVLFTCISTACFSANIHAVLKLHEAGVPLDGPMWEAVEEGSSAMLMAEVSGDQSLIDALLELGLDPVDPMESIFAEQFETGMFPRLEPKPETQMPLINAFKGLSY